MTDAIRTNTFQSNQQITGREAAAYEKQLEGETLGKVDEKALSDIVLKQLNGDKISPADTQKLLDSCEGLTAKDIDGLVADGKLNRQEGDALLLASTLSAFKDGNAGASDIADAMNKFYSMNSADQEATLNTFAKQGNYQRNMSLEFNDDRSLKSSSYQLSVRGEELSPGDLPSTPKIQRAALFLMSKSSVATDSGAIQAFTNWDFQTANDQMSAMLGSLPNYENLSQTEQDSLAKYLTAAGRVAAGNPNAASISPERAAQLDEAKEQIADQKADHEAAYKALDNLLKPYQGVVDMANVNVKLSDGKDVSLFEYCVTNNIAFPNIDGDHKLSDTEIKGLLANIKGHETILDHQNELCDMELNGASKDTIDKMQVNFQDQREAEIALEAVNAWKSDWEGGGGHARSINIPWLGHYEIPASPIKMEGIQFSCASNLDQDGKPLPDGQQRTVEYNLKDYLTKHDVAFSDKGNTAGMTWADADNDYTLSDDEMDDLAKNLQDHLNDLKNDATAIRSEHKADWPGGQELIDQLKDAAGQQKDWQACEEVLTMAARNKGDGVDVGGCWFTDHNGDRVNCSEFLRSNGIDYPHDPGSDNTFMEMADLDKLKAGALADKIDSFEKLGESLTQQLKDLQPPEHQLVRRSTDGGLGGMRPADQMSDADRQAEIDRLKTMDPKDLTEQEKQFLVDDTVHDIKNRPDYDPDDSYDFDTARKDVESGWSADKKQGFNEALDQAKNQLNDGKVMGPDQFADLGFKPGDILDIGMLMFTIMSDRTEMLGEQIQSIIKVQQKNTNDQKDMNNAIAALNTAGDTCNLKDTTFTLSDGSTTNLADYFNSHEVKYDNQDGDDTLGSEEIKTCIANCKGAAEGLSNEGQSVLNELTQLSQKYQQAESLMMNFLEKFDAMKQKVIDKIRAN